MRARFGLNMLVVGCGALKKIEKKTKTKTMKQNSSLKKSGLGCFQLLRTAVMILPSLLKYSTDNPISSE